MIVPGCLVIQRPNGWEIILGNQTDFLASTVDPRELAVCATLMLQMSGMKNAQVVLAPATDACFFVRLQPSSDIDTRDRSALTYELEDHLPIDAESMAADFVPIESPGDVAKTIGSVAIGISPWDDIIDAFESTDLPVRSIVPAAVLATRAFCDGADLAETVELFLIDDDGRWDCIQVRNETILSWHHLSLDPPSLKRHCVLDRLPAERTVIVGGDIHQHEVIRAAVPESIVHDESRDALIHQGTKLLLDNRSQRWFDLRRDLLGPKDPLRAIGRQLRWAAVAAAACFLALAIGGWWRSNRIEQAITQTQAEQAELFRNALPEKRATGAVLRQVRSEHTRVLSSRGQNTDIEIPVSAPMVLRQLLASLPTDVRFYIQSIDILDGVVTIDIDVRRNIDASTIAEAISNYGFSVPAPSVRRSQKNDNEYSATIEATWVERPRSSSLDGEVSG